MSFVGENFPIVLDCGDKICLKCFKESGEYQIQKPECKVECTKCQKTSSLNLAWIDKQILLMKDTYLKNLMVSNFRCKKHPQEGINFFCPDDE